MDELIRPNWHIAMVHFPIALLAVGIVVELFSFLGWRRSGFRAFGRWAILLGAIASVPTTFSGLYAIGENNVLKGSLAELEQTNPAAAKAMWDHLWMMSVATGGAMFLVVAWIALSDAWRDRLSLLFKLGLLGVLGLTIAGSHNGGEIVYAHHIGPHDQGPATYPTSLPDMPVSQMLDGAFNAMQTHVVLSGIAIAVACVCLGWSIRSVTQAEDLGTADELASAQRIAAAFGTLNEAHALLGDGQRPLSVNHTPPVRNARFWLLSALLALLAAGTGIWYLSISQDSYDIDTLRRAISHPAEDNGPEITRRFVHTLTGLVIIGDSLLLAMLSLVARRNAIMLFVLAVPMIAALAIQVWLGILLVMEGPQGTVTGFIR